MYRRVYKCKLNLLKYKIFVLYVSLSLYNIFAQDSLSTVAVLDFEALGITLQEAQTLTERLRTEIGKTDAVRLIERKALDKILEEQGLQQTGCVSAECAAEVGMLLGAQYMISGAIGKVGKFYTIDVKMFSVETGTAVRTKSISYSGPIEGLLTEMEILAWEIVGLEAPQYLKLKREMVTEGKDARPTVAVLDFEGRGITQLEAQTLTDRFGSELGETKTVRLIGRKIMNEVLTEQGFASAGCSSEECAAEVGALLGVQFMISGAIGKVGNTYTIDAKMFSVATGAAERTKSITYQGEVDGLITEIEILAWKVVELQPPKRLLKKKRLGTKSYLARETSSAMKTRTGALIRSLFIPGLGQFYLDQPKWGYSWIGTEVVLSAAIYKYYTDYRNAKDGFNKYNNLYQQEMDSEQVQIYKAKSRQYHDELVTARNQVKIYSGLVIGIWTVNVVHAYLAGPKPGAFGYLDDATFQVAYNYEMNQTQLRWTIALD